MLRQLFDVIEQPVTVRDTNGDIVFANRASLASMGFESLEGMREVGTAKILDDYRFEDEHGNLLGHDDIPSVRLLRGEAADPLLARVVSRRTGEIRWSMLRASELKDPEGTLAGVLTVIEDVTAAKSAEVRARVLAESGRLLASSLDYEQTLANVASISVPAVADYCALDLVDDLGRLQRVAAHLHAEGAAPGLDGLGALDPFWPEPEHPTAGVLATGRAVFFSDLSNAELETVARSGEHLALLRELGPRSAILAPMTVSGQTIGVMTFASAGSGRRFVAEDVGLAEQLARRAAVAVQNARLYARLMGVAETVQRSLLPRPLPDVPRWDIASLYKPAETELRVDVGGDFYEFFEHHGVWYAIFGDVSGKGIAAASVTALMRHGSRVASRAEPEPGAILERLNEALLDQPEDLLCTAVCMCLHPEHIMISSAGHPPPLLITPGRELRELSPPGPILGAFNDVEYPEERVDLQPGELMLLYTDGITEAPGRAGRFGIDRLREVLLEHAGASPAQVLEQIEVRLAQFSPPPARDDIAALALRTRG